MYAHHKICAACNGFLFVKESRPSPRFGVWRHRVYVCKSCKRRVRTEEVIVSGAAEPKDRGTAVQDQIIEARERIQAVLDDLLPGARSYKADYEDEK